MTIARRPTRWLFMLTLSSATCSGPSPPTGPSAPTAVQYVFTQISGTVLDTAFRPINGVNVETVDGSEAGVSVITDANGRFLFSGGMYADGIKFRATKDGYTTKTVTGPLQFPWPSAVAYLNITLESLAPPVKIEPGDYTLTVVADKSCTDIPSAFRSRTYDATITLAPPAAGLQPNTHYDVEVSGPSLSPFGFGIGVAGNYLQFEIDGPAFSESFDPFTYLEIAGVGGTTVEKRAVTTLSIPFSGSFEYCLLKSEMGGYNNCYTTPADQKIAHAQCLSMNDQMILQRR